MIPQRLSIRKEQPLQTREETMKGQPRLLVYGTLFFLPKAVMISSHLATPDAMPCRAVVYITHCSCCKHLLSSNNTLVALAVVLVTTDFLVLPLLLVHKSLKLCIVVLRDRLGCHLDSAHAASSAD